MPSNPTASTHAAQNPAWKALAEFSLPSQPGSDSPGWEQVAAAVRGLNLSSTNLTRLKTAIVKATLNAIEHNNRYQTKLPIFIQVLVLEQVSTVGRTDQGNRTIPDGQIGQACGFFLIHKMKDGAHGHAEEARHTIELFLYREGDLR
jgi:anti-sigma regulatory factor (Ser/Thr protein kinase)